MDDSRIPHGCVDFSNNVPEIIYRALSRVPRGYVDSSCSRETMSCDSTAYRGNRILLPLYKKYILSNSNWRYLSRLYHQITYYQNVGQSYKANDKMTVRTSSTQFFSGGFAPKNMLTEAVFFWKIIPLDDKIGCIYAKIVIFV